jgi:hypothetical protein
MGEQNKERKGEGNWNGTRSYKNFGGQFRGVKNTRFFLNRSITIFD